MFESQLAFRHNLGLILARAPIRTSADVVSQSCCAGSTYVRGWELFHRSVHFSE